jgi:hypothetical protein
MRMCSSCELSVRVQDAGMRVLEVNPGSTRTGPHILKLLGEATASHRVHWRNNVARGKLLNSGGRKCGDATFACAPDSVYIWMHRHVVTC